MIDINILEFIPKELRQQAQDTLVDFVSEQAKKFVSDGVADKLKQLRTDGAFRKQFDKGLDKALKRFTEEYYEKDEDLVDAIVQEKDIFKSTDVKQALMTMLKSPGSYLADEGDVVAQTFDSVLPDRKNRERVNKAMMYLLRCLVEELWHLPELQPVYSLQFQKITAEAMKQQVELQKVQLQALTGVNEGIRQALLQLTDAIGEKKLLSSGSDSQTQSEPRVLHNLPNTEYGQFIGREKEISKIHQILRPYPHSQHSLVTIDGIGGIGKSALALEVAYYYLRNYRQLNLEERFDAIIWVSAKQTVLTTQGIQKRPQAFRALDDIYAAIAITLRRQDITKVSEYEQVEVVRSALTQQKTLLIIDNLETVDDEKVITFLMELPAPTKAIVTTRHRVDIAYPIRLVGLNQEEAEQFIWRECEKRNCELTKSDAQRLYKYTGGIPLALVWSIAQISSGYSPESVLRRLGDAGNDIARFCFEGVVEAIQTETAFELLLALSIFETDASRESLGFVSDLSEYDRDEGLVVLEKLSLINKNADRFSMLPLTKVFSHFLLDKDPQKSKALRQKQHQYYITKLEKFSKERKASDLIQSTERRKFRELETENILSHVEWLKSVGETENIPYLVRGVSGYLWAVGQWSTCHHYGLMALELSQNKTPHNKEMEAYLLFRIGRIDLMRGNNEISEKRILGSMDLYRELGNTSRLAHAASYLGILYINQKRYQDAENALIPVLQQARQADDKKAIARIQNVVGQTYLGLEKYDLAESAIVEALNLRDNAGASTGLAASYELLGRIKLLQDKPAESVQYFRRCYEISEEVNVQWYAAFAKRWLAEAMMKLGDRDGALANLKESIEIFKSTGMTDKLAEATELLETLEAQN